MILVSSCCGQVCHAREFIVVRDPGHGGKDAGALGKKTNEKSINLNVAKKLRALLLDTMDDVKVDMTRDDDRFITLQGRADFANRKHADIFVSIHANSVKKTSPNHNTVNGAAVYTLGLDRSDTNLSVAMRENEVMKLEADYSTTYQGFDPSSTESYIAFEMMQHKNMDQSITLAEAVQNQLVRHAGRKNNGVRQAPFWVLVRTSMPSILVELDFICIPTREEFMASEKGSSQRARAIYNGIKSYRESSSSTAPAKSRKSEKKEEPKAKAAPSVTETPTATPAETDGEIVYRIQFLVVPSPLKAGDKKLKGLEADYYTAGGKVKYTTGAYTSAREASAHLADVKKKFPDAFVIKTCDGKRIK